MWFLRFLASFVCVVHGGQILFSTKKFYAFVFATLGIINYVWLIFCGDSHWTVILTSKGVKEVTLGLISGGFDALIVGALAVYGFAKIGEKKAGIN